MPEPRAWRLPVKPPSYNNRGPLTTKTLGSGPKCKGCKQTIEREPVEGVFCSDFCFRSFVAFAEGR